MRAGQATAKEVRFQLSTVERKRTWYNCTIANFFNGSVMSDF